VPLENGKASPPRRHRIALASASLAGEKLRQRGEPSIALADHETSTSSHSRAADTAVRAATRSSKASCIGEAKVANELSVFSNGLAPLTRRRRA